MLRRMTAILLGIVMMGTCFAMAEGVSLPAEPVQPEELTVEEAYEAWFLTVYPLLYSCYADSTWISNSFSFYRNGERVHYEVTYLLKEDPFTITEEEMETFSSIDSDAVNNLYHMYSFIHVTPVTLAAVRAMKTTMVKDVPAEYAYVDLLIEQMMTDMELLRFELVDHISANSTMEGFNTATGSTKAKVKREWHKVELLYNLVK